MNPLAYKLAEEFKKALVDDQIYSAINVTNYESLYLSKFFFSLTRTFFKIILYALNHNHL